MPEALLIGCVVGLILSALQRHPRRVIGILPFAALLLLLAIIAHCLFSIWTGLTDFNVGIVVGLSSVPIACLIVGGPRYSTCRLKNPVWGIVISIVLCCWPILLPSVDASEDATPVFAALPIWILLPAAAIVTCASIFFFFREAGELIIGFILWPMYRIRGAGLGLEAIPRRGPLIIIANHACWMDPLFLGWILPRRLFPMMGSKFYDLPGLRWMMVNLVKAIRVQESEYRRDAPELKEAVEVLDRDGCIVIFPEGRMRRAEDRPVHRFGQGIWHILSERPNTPFVCCWIEGGWGSFCSYKGGNPTKNKRPDFRRLIRVGISEPECINPELLGSLKETRQFLMQRCAAAREHLGLEPHSLIKAEIEENGTFGESR